MKYLLVSLLLLFSVNVYAQSFLCEVRNQTTAGILGSKEYDSIKMVEVQISDRKVILFEKEECSVKM